jgi:hypothetical protein
MVYHVFTDLPGKDEFIDDDADVSRTCWVSLEELGDMIGKGIIKDGKTMLAYYRLYSK